jgi:hypothetical protein
MRFTSSSTDSTPFVGVELLDCELVITALDCFTRDHTHCLLDTHGYLVVHRRALDKTQRIGGRTSHGMLSRIDIPDAFVHAPPTGMKTHVESRTTPT